MTYVVIMDFTGKFSYPLANKAKGYVDESLRVLLTDEHNKLLGG